MAKGGSQPQVQYVKTEQSNLPEYARPYFEGLMQSANAQLSRPYVPYGYTQNQAGEVVRAIDPNTGQPVDATRIAGFTPEQVTLQKQVLNLQTPQQFQQASGLAAAAAQRALGGGSAQMVTAPTVEAEKMVAAQTGYKPNLTAFQMELPDQFGQAQAQQYMSPYIQNVMDIQKREAIRDAKQAQLAQDLGLARQGAYGGSRGLLGALNRERMLGTQLGDIQAKGLQSAYENAQAQFERDRTARMDALKQNLASQIATQQLQTTTDMQTAFKNLDADQQARVANQAAENQARGMNAENALRAALANQQASLQAQQISMQGLGIAGQMAQTIGNLGQYQLQSDLSRLSAQQQAAAQEQALQQQAMDQRYQDYLRQRDYPMEQLQQYSSLLRGVPITPSTTQTGYAPAPSLASQLVGTGLGAASMYNMFKGG